MNETNKIIPALRVNNRRVNQAFLENNLGFKTYLEDAAFAEFGAKENSDIQLVLIESPSMRTRAVKGPKKLNKLVIHVQHPAEIGALLARGAVFTKLYKGVNGYAFESISPENDCFLLHAEDEIAQLNEILPPVAFQFLDGFEQLTSFSVEKIIINTPQPSKSRKFYDIILPGQQVLEFREAAGKDLVAANAKTWDLDSLRIPVPTDIDWSFLEERMQAPFFKDKKERFLQTTDMNNIELWFEK